MEVRIYRCHKETLNKGLPSVKSAGLKITCDSFVPRSADDCYNTEMDIVEQGNLPDKPKQGYTSCINNCKFYNRFSRGVVVKIPDKIS